MKQKIVIKVSMPCERSRSKAMALVARAAGVISVGITGDGQDRLEVVGDGVDAVRLVSCLRKRIVHAEILQVEEVKAKKSEDKKEKERKPEEEEAKLTAVHPLPQYYTGYGYYHYVPPPPFVVHDEPTPCSIM
uniref:HMA domain-containing protein n=1 Tax=Leersia perrieri TaxID=77586 RepID=A0A0D9W615_9ORYZ